MMKIVHRARRLAGILGRFHTGILASMLFFLPPAAVAAVYDYRTGPFSFNTEFGEAFLQWVDPAASGSLVIPSEISFYDDEFQVTRNLQVTDIWDQAFQNCTKVTEVTVPSSVSGIRSYAFENCTALRTVHMPSGIHTLPEGLFSGCTSLESFTIPSTVSGIGHDAFLGCNNLREITIPDSVTSIGTAFEGCTGLTKVSIGKGLATVSGFANCTGLVDVALSSEMTAFGNFAFEGCTSIGSLTIPGNVTRVGVYAFAGCTSMESVVVPASVTEIEEGAFSRCTALKSCIFLGDAPARVDQTAFADSPGLTIFYYPEQKGFTTPTWKGVNCVPLGAPVNPSTAVVIAIKGNVTAKSALGKGSSLTLGMEVGPGTEITTATQSFVRIALPNGSVYNVSPNSSITLNYTTIGVPASPPRREIFLKKGGVHIYHSNTSGELLYIKTKTAGIGVRGTTLTVQASEENGMMRTTTEVLEGEVEQENLITGEVTPLRTGDLATLEAVSSYLSGLVLDNGTLSPSFDPALTEYAASVKNRVEQISLTPTASDAGASLLLNGAPWSSGATSSPVPLQVGVNTITLKVVARDGSTETSYLLRVTREGSPNNKLESLVLKGGKLGTVFKPGKSKYEAVVKAGQESLRIRAKVADPIARIYLLGRKVKSGKLSQPIKLRRKGNTVVKIRVKAQNGDERVYRLSISRLAQTISS